MGSKADRPSCRNISICVGVIMSVGKNVIQQEVRPDAASIDAAHQQISDVERANRTMISNVRQGAQLAIFTAQAVGLVIDQSLTLLIEASLLAIEVGQAISIGAFGLTSIVQIGAIIAMGMLIVRIKQQRTESARRTAGVVSALRLAGFRSG